MNSAVVLSREEDDQEDLLSSMYPHAQSTKGRKDKGFVLEERCDTALEESDKLESSGRSIKKNFISLQDIMTTKRLSTKNKPVAVKNVKKDYKPFVKRPHLRKGRRNIGLR